MKKLFLLFLFSATSLCFLPAQDVLNIYYEAVPGNMNTDTVKVYVRSSTESPINVRSVNFSFAYKGACANWQGSQSIESLLVTQWGSFLQGFSNTNPLPIPKTYEGQLYSSRFSYGNASAQTVNMIVAPVHSGPMLEVFSTVFDGSCSNNIYMEDQAEHPVNQMGTHDNQPMPYTIARFGNGLPVEYSYFNVEKVSGKHALITWATEKEINNDYFVIEKSFDPSFDSIIPLAQITGRGTANGIENYSYDDKSPMASLVYYRLRQVDIDGFFSFSDVKTLAFENLGTLNLVAFPNPAVDFVNLRTLDSQESMYEYRLLDLTGRQLIHKIKMLGESYGDSFRLDISDLSQGIYYLEVINLDKNGDAKTLKILKK